MGRIVLYGATGYTGRLTAHALHRRGVDFAIVGRNRTKLEELAATVGNPDVFTASTGDPSALIAALDGAGSMITCVGPFVQHGWTAVEAALTAGVHYVDSTGEGAFIRRMIDEKGEAASRRGIVMAPAMGFDEVPGDVASSLAADGMGSVEMDVTYAIPTTASVGTLKSLLGIIASPGARVEDGKLTRMTAGDRFRWAPMPPPLGPRRAVSAPLALAHLAPLHLDLDRYDTYFTVGRAQKLAMKPALPTLGMVMKVPGAKGVIDRLLGFLPEGPEGDARSARWTILAEARSGDNWRNVTVTGIDVYGLTAETLSAAAVHLAERPDGPVGVLPPVAAVGLDVLQKTLLDLGTTITTYDTQSDPGGD